MATGNLRVAQHQCLKKLYQACFILERILNLTLERIISCLICTPNREDFGVRCGKWDSKSLAWPIQPYIYACIYQLNKVSFTLRY